MKANELIDKLDISAEDMIRPISNLFSANVINDEQFTLFVNHVQKVYNSAYKHGYWKGIQLTKGNDFVLQVLGDARTGKE